MNRTFEKGSGAFDDENPKKKIKMSMIRDHLLSVSFIVI